jgi:hypothetical protein
MKTLLLAVTVLVLTMTSYAQDIVKLYPDDTMKDSIIYKNGTSILVINRVDFDNYMFEKDTMLQKACYSDNRVFRSMQFSRLTAQELETHFTDARAYLADSTHTDLQFSTDKFTMFWTDNENMLLPYVEDMLSSLLLDGRIKVIDKSTKLSVPQYTIFYEDIDGQPYRIYKLPSGKIIYKESNYFLEQFATIK